LLLLILLSYEERIMPFSTYTVSDFRGGGQPTSDNLSPMQFLQQGEKSVRFLFIRRMKDKKRRSGDGGGEQTQISL